MMRDKIISEARTWLDTRWHHQGRIKKNVYFQGGVDCAGLIIEVGNALQLSSPPLIYQNYGRLPQDVLHLCDHYLVKKPITKLLPGDISLFRIGKRPQHLAIFTEKNSIIHAYVQARKVVENNLSEEWQARIVAVYHYPGITDDN